MHDVLGFILGGGRGAGLHPLTRHRSAPAVMVAGNYRLIDVPISNCINSGLQRVYVLTQFLSVSLHRHIARTYKFDPFSRGFIDVLPAQQTNEAADWYQGTADALRQNLRYLQFAGARHLLILSGDGLYRMNLRELVQTHEETAADLTIAVQVVRRSQAAQVGVVRLAEGNRIIDLVEKPQTPAQLDALRAPADWLEARGLAGTSREHPANMGIYLFRRDVLLDLLRNHPRANDLVTELIARALSSHRVQAHVFDGYWQDIGTIKTYHEANLALAGAAPPFDFHNADGVIYTHMRNLPASQVQAAVLEHALVGDGCRVLSGTRIERAVIGLRAQIGRDAVIRDTVIAGADRYETEAEQAVNRANGIPAMGVGDGAVIERAILDKDCRIGAGVRIVNEGHVRDAEAEHYVIRDGIVVIPRGAVVPDGTVI